MSTLKINWGARIAILYGGFVALITILVAGSMQQDFNLVTPDYYNQEIKYQQVIDAGKNQAALSAPVIIHANSDTVSIDFPAEFEGKVITGTIHFYSPVNEVWDRMIPIDIANNTMSLPRTALHTTTYKVKLDWESDGKKYYQESEINLH